MRTRSNENFCVHALKGRYVACRGRGIGYRKRGPGQERVHGLDIGSGSSVFTQCRELAEG